MDFFNIIKEVLLRPKDFFAKTKKEKGIKNAFLYFFIFTVITTFLSILYFYRAFSMIKIPQMPSISGSILIIVLAILYILILLFTIIYLFVISGITHLFILLMKGKQGFYQTFKVMIYGDTPRYILSILLSPITILVYPKFFGIKTMPPEFLMWLIPTIILGFIITAYTIYLKTIGIKNLHEISTFRAFAAVFLLPMALFILIYLLIFVFFYSGLFLNIKAPS